MKSNQVERDDPVVSEVRAIRAKLWKEGGGTIEGFLKLLHREAKTKRIRRARPARKRAASR